MPNLKRVRDVVQILLDAGLPETEYLDMDHDILFVPWHEREGEIAKRLEDSGCHWSEDADSWATF